MLNYQIVYRTECALLLVHGLLTYCSLVGRVEKLVDFESQSPGNYKTLEVGLFSPVAVYLGKL